MTVQGDHLAVFLMDGSEVAFPELFYSKSPIHGRV
jgi:hypothetical protein